MLFATLADFMDGLNQRRLLSRHRRCEPDLAVSNHSFPKANYLTRRLWEALSALAAECVIESMGDDHQAAANQCQQNLLRMCGQVVAPPSGSNQARQAGQHQKQDSPAPMPAETIGKSNRSQQSDNNCQNAVGSFLGGQKVRRDN